MNIVKYESTTQELVIRSAACDTPILVLTGIHPEFGMPLVTAISKVYDEARIVGKQSVIKQVRGLLTMVED